MNARGRGGSDLARGSEAAASHTPVSLYGLEHRTNSTHTRSLGPAHPRYPEEVAPLASGNAYHPAAQQTTSGRT